jgi:hypothetical protein
LVVFRFPGDYVAVICGISPAPDSLPHDVVRILCREPLSLEAQPTVVAVGPDKDLVR